jgi:hypothetical protein
MRKVIVVNDFGTAIDKKSNKPKYGFRPQVGKAIRLNEQDYKLVKADGLVEDVAPKEVKKKRSRLPKQDAE